MKARDLTGQRFGRIVAIERVPRPPYYTGTDAWWRCRCDCGTEILLPAKSMRTGNSKSCGCYKLDLLRGKPSRRKKVNSDE